MLQHSIAMFSREDFDIFYKSIKQELTSDADLSIASADWIFYQRELYWGRDFKYGSFLDTHVDKLDTLNPLLGFDWKGQSGGRRCTIEWFLVIRKDLTEGVKLSNDKLRWLKKCESKFHKTPDKLSDEDIRYLDTLTPLLGYDWRNPPRVAVSNFYTSVDQIYQSLQQNTPLTQNQKYWLTRVANQFHNPKKSISIKQINYLKKLDEYLDYGWRAGHGGLSFTENAERIVRDFGKDYKATYQIKAWITKQQKLFAKGVLTPKQIQKLDACTQQLPYDWKVERKLRKLRRLS